MASDSFYPSVVTLKRGMESLKTKIIHVSIRTTLRDVFEELINDLSLELSPEDKSSVSVQYGDFEIHDIDSSVISILENHKDRRAMDSLVFQLQDEPPNPVITKEKIEAYAKFFTDKAYFLPKRTSPSPEWINSVDRTMTRFNNVMAGFTKFSF